MPATYSALMLKKVRMIDLIDPIIEHADLEEAIDFLLIN